MQLRDMGSPYCEWHRTQRATSQLNITPFLYRYCMPWTRHLLQSVEIQSVTQTRVSDDYTPSNEQWKIGVTTILAQAMGLAAFKDVSSA